MATTIAAATKLSDFNAGFLPPTLTDYIFERAAQQSVLMQLAPRVPLGLNGSAIPVVTSRPQAGWVSEAAAKPKTKGGVDLKSITSVKLAAIMVDSVEVIRLNPGGYVTRMRDLMAEAFAIAFDRAGFHDEGPDGTAGGGPFATNLDGATKVSEIGAANAAAGGVHTDLINAMTDIVSDTDSTGRRYRLTGFALDAVLEPVLRGSVDSTGRPLLSDLPTNANSSAIGLGQGSILGRPAFVGEGVATADLTSVVGYAGDFKQCAWGASGGIEYTTSTEGTVTINGELVSLFENNLVAFRAEAWYGFLVPDVAAFSKLTNVGNSPVTSS
jgi:HK97 family phage major capsid protein